MLSDIVIKNSNGHSYAEASKLKAYAKHGKGHYRVPIVIECRRDSDSMTMERVYGYKPLLTSYLRSAEHRQESLEQFHAAGSALADIHACSSLDEAWVRELLGPFCKQPSPGLVLLHGDFGFSNVFVRSGDPLPLVIDPGPNRVTTLTAVEVGPPIRDLAIMMSCILGRVPFGQVHKIIAIPRVDLARAFFDGYSSVRPVGASLGACLEEGQTVLGKYLVQIRGVPRVLAHVLSKALLQRMKRP